MTFVNMNFCNTIYKFPLEIKPVQHIEMPLVLRPLTVQVQNGVPTLWAEVNQRAEKRFMKVAMYPTGGEAPAAHEQYLGTVQVEGFVWHYFINPVPVKDV